MVSEGVLDGRINGRINGMDTPASNSAPRITASIDKAGRIVVPKSVRDRLYLKAGDRLEVFEQGGSVTFQPIRPKPRMVYRHGIWIRSGTAPSTYDPVRAIEDMRRERDEQVYAHSLVNEPCKNRD